MSESKIDKDALLTEYSATNDAYMHYDNLSWQVGSVLIAGVFVFWGFLSDPNVEANLIIASSILISILMSAWMLYSDHNRQIFLCKLHRLYEIENLLGLKQHLRWGGLGKKSEPDYRTFGPSGHSLNAFIYAMTSLGAPVIAFIRGERTILLAVPILIVVGVLIWINRNEGSLSEKLKNIS
jgi:hypothetical protein